MVKKNKSIDELVSEADEFTEDVIPDETDWGAKSIEDFEEFDTEPPLPRDPPINILSESDPIFLTDVTIKKINVKFHGLMPEHELEAIKMHQDGVPLGEIAEHFGMAKSDIVYTNKSR